ncbi:hypothetical protein HZA99_05645 [Candidatus Woesearchaeota archaeon]|nr:hypothetical protein [Candidatus Woesearchaeota archaeon]
MILRKNPGGEGESSLQFDKYTASNGWQRCEFTNTENTDIPMFSCDQKPEALDQQLKIELGDYVPKISNAENTGGVLNFTSQEGLHCYILMFLKEFVCFRNDGLILMEEKSMGFFPLIIVLEGYDWNALDHQANDILNNVLYPEKLKELLEQVNASLQRWRTEVDSVEFHESLRGVKLESDFNNKRNECDLAGTANTDVFSVESSVEKMNEYVNNTVKQDHSSLEEMQVNLNAQKDIEGVNVVNNNLTDFNELYLRQLEHFDAKYDAVKEEINGLC